MALVNLNKEERDRKRAEILGMFTHEDGLKALTWLIEDADVARGWYAMQCSHRNPYVDRTAMEFGRQHFDRFVRRAADLTPAVRDALLAYVSEGAGDFTRPLRMEARGQDAEIIKELLDRGAPITKAQAAELFGDKL